MAGTGRNAIALRPVLAQDGPGLAALLRASVEELTADDYTPAQQEAWISSAADDEDAFATRLQGMLTLVASIDGQVAGFASLKGKDHIEMLYIAPPTAGQGVAAALCDALEKLAHARGAASLTVDASDTAQGFFAKRGYESRQRGTVALGDEWLGRTAMKKSLGDPARVVAAND